MIFVHELGKSFALTKETQKQFDHHKRDFRQEAKVFHALQNVSFRCEKGEVLGLLGPNGAGKTTTLRILAGALKPDAGEVVINGHNLLTSPQKAKQAIGFLSNHTGLYQRLTAYENLQYFAQLHGVSKPAFKAHCEQLISQLAMEDYIHRRIDTLSTGMKQKVSIARCVIHQPQVVILDEPTTGLDIMATETILSFIQALKEQDIAVIFSTHHLDEVELLADKISIINQGSSCFFGTRNELITNTQSSSLREAFMASLAFTQVKSDQMAEEASS